MQKRPYWLQMTWLRVVADDIIHLELSFWLETPNDVFNTILMYFENIFLSLS